MQRMNPTQSDRGAVAVWTAILMVPLMIVAALALDVAGMHADRQRLQIGADAGALAVAQDCADGACSDTDATAQELATANDPLGGPATGAVTELDMAAGRVEVRTTSDRDHWFAPVIGDESATMAAVSAAAWGYPTGGGSLPLTFAWCEILHHTNATPIYENGALVGLDIHGGKNDVVLYNKSNKDANFHSCDASDVMPTQPSGLAPSGGFGWLAEGSTTPCTGLETAAGGWYDSDTGNDHPDNCTAADLAKLLGHTVLIPVFDGTNGQTGANADYHIFGYIGFRFEGYYFGNGWASPTPPCDEPNRCISGDIVEFVDYASGFTTSPDGPQLGTELVSLQLPSEG